MTQVAPPSAPPRAGPLRIGVVGAGAWGTALALVGARAGHHVTLWCRDPAQAAELATRRSNERRLPGVALPASIAPTPEPADLASCDLWLLAMPAQHLRSSLRELRDHVPAGCPMVITAKGIEQHTELLLVDVLVEVTGGMTAPPEPLVLSGPSFAADVARGLPTAVTLAARSEAIARPVAEALSLPTFRPYISDDIVGVQIGGAVKNVLAIAAGIVSGRGLGESARAALIARAFAELSKLGRAFGARPETLGGLSGLGDLVLTASSQQSRNFSFGIALGKGTRASVIVGHGVTEGAFTAEAALKVARAHGVDVPIIEAVRDVVSERASVDEVIERLMQRPLRTEF